MTYDRVTTQKGVRRIFLSTNYGASLALNLGRFNAYRFDDGADNTVYCISWQLPLDFKKIISAKFVGLASVSGNLYYQNLIAIAKNGDSYNAAESADTIDISAMTGNKITELRDFSSLFANAKAGDIIGVALRRDASHANDTINSFFYGIGAIIDFL